MPLGDLSVGRTRALVSYLNKLSKQDGEPYAHNTSMTATCTSGPSLRQRWRRSLSVAHHFRAVPICVPGTVLGRRSLSAGRRSSASLRQSLEAEAGNFTTSW